MEKLSRISRYLTDRVLSLVAPRCCLACNGWLTDKEMVLCFDCLQNLNFYSPEYYDAFSEFKPSKKVPVSPQWEHCFPLLTYSPETPEARFVINIKGHSSLDQRLTAGIMLGRRISLYYRLNGKPMDIDFIIPAPIIREREKRRGYSQTYDVAKGIGAELGIDVRNDIISNEGTEYHIREFLMHGSDRDKLRKNKYVVNSNAEELVGKHILIFDDQITSGSTIYKLCDLIQRATKGNVRFSIASLSLSSSCMK